MESATRKQQGSPRSPPYGLRAERVLPYPWMIFLRAAVRRVQTRQVLESHAQEVQGAEHLRQLAADEGLLLQLARDLVGLLRQEEPDPALVVDDALVLQVPEGAHGGVGIHLDALRQLPGRSGSRCPRFFQVPLRMFSHIRSAICR